MYETKKFGLVAADRGYGDAWAAFDRDKKSSEVPADRGYGGDSFWAAFDREGRLVTSSYDGKIRLYGPDFRLIRSKKAPGGAQPFGVALSPDGAQVVVGYDDSTRVDVLDGRTLTPLFQPDATGVYTGDFHVVTWSVDGRFLYAGGRWPKIVDGRWLDHARRWTDGGRGLYQDIPLATTTRSWNCGRSRTAASPLALKTRPLAPSLRAAKSSGARIPPRQTCAVKRAGSLSRATALASFSVSSSSATHRPHSTLRPGA